MSTEVSTCLSVLCYTLRGESVWPLVGNTSAAELSHTMYVTLISGRTTISDPMSLPLSVLTERIPRDAY